MKKDIYEIHEWPEQPDDYEEKKKCPHCGKEL